MEDKVRLDKFLWAVRLFKKRPDAADACTKGSILVNNQSAKPSKSISVGDKIYVKTNPIYRIYKVTAILNNRVGAQLVENYITEVTPEDDLFKLKMYHEFQKTTPKRDKPGRPTKKDRRDLDDFFGSWWKSEDWSCEFEERT